MPPATQAASNWCLKRARSEERGLGGPGPTCSLSRFCSSCHSVMGDRHVGDLNSGPLLMVAEDSASGTDLAGKA